VNDLTLFLRQKVKSGNVQPVLIVHDQSPYDLQKRSSTANIS
jgi:hypothetical protein